MSVQRVGLSVLGAVLLIIVVLGLATVWLYLTDPITVANAVNKGDVTSFIRDLAQILLDVLQGLLKYL